MKVDKLFSHTFSVFDGGSKSHDLGYGNVNGLLITSQNYSKDTQLDVKVRTPHQTYVLANRLPLGFIANLSNLKYGVNSFNSITEQISNFGDALEDVKLRFEDINSLSTDPLPDFDWLLYDTTVTSRANLSMQGFYIDLGSIFLDRDSELEIQLSTPGSGETGNVTYSVYSVQRNNDSEMYIQYDQTKDFDTNQTNVREVYFHDVERSFSSSNQKTDFQIDTTNQTYLYDYFGAALSTNVFSRLEGLPEITLFRLYSENNEIPASLRVKVNTEFEEGKSLVFLKEIYPDSLTKSNADKLADFQTRVRKLESSNAKLAEKLRHSGKIAKSSEIEKAREVAESNVKQEQSDSE